MRHMGFVLIGIYAGNFLTLQGLVIQMLAHGLCASGLFILSGQLYERLHTRDLREMGGLWARFTYLPPLLMFFAAALLGIPGTANFVGESDKVIYNRKLFDDIYENLNMKKPNLKYPLRADDYINYL